MASATSRKTWGRSARWPPAEPAFGGLRVLGFRLSGLGFRFSFRSGVSGLVLEVRVGGPRV